MEHKKIWIAGVMGMIACIFLGVAFRPARMPLVVVASDPNIHVSSVVCTVGTNHVYYHGDAMDRLLDPLITRFSDTNAYRLRCDTAKTNTVVWIRFEHPDYGIVPALGIRAPFPAPFCAQLIDTNGVVAPLSVVSVRMRNIRRRFFVMAWEIAGQLEDHRGSTLRIEATNGTGAVTFKVP